MTTPLAAPASQHLTRRQLGPGATPGESFQRKGPAPRGCTQGSKRATRDIHATPMEQEEVSQSLPCPRSGHSCDVSATTSASPRSRGGGGEGGGGKGTGADAADGSEPPQKTVSQPFPWVTLTELNPAHSFPRQRAPWGLHKAGGNISDTSHLPGTEPPRPAPAGDGAPEGGCPGSREAGCWDKAPGFLAASAPLAGSPARLASGLPEPG